jgi:hypothetical protein
MARRDGCLLSHLMTSFQGTATQQYTMSSVDIYPQVDNQIDDSITSTLKIFQLCRVVPLDVHLYSYIAGFTRRSI